jgi:hypothetical protein
VLVGTRVASAQLALKALAVGLTQKRLVKGDVQCIFSARVPIIKFEMAESGLAFDVCCEQPGGPLAADHVKQLLQQWPALKPLALVLKVRGGTILLLSHQCCVAEVLLYMQDRKMFVWGGCACHVAHCYLQINAVLLGFCCTCKTERVLCRFVVLVMLLCSGGVLEELLLQWSQEDTEHVASW